MSNEAKLAQLLCGYSLDIGKDDIVLVRGEVCAQPLIKALYKEIVQRGAHPIIQMSFSEQQAVLFKYGSDHQFKYISPMDNVQADTVTAQISIDSTDNSRQLTNADSSKIAMHQKVRGDLRDKLFVREAEGKFRWVVAPYPTQAMAQDAGMSLEDYSNFVYKACKLDADDPVKLWQAVCKEQQRIVELLMGKKNIRVVGKNTDISFNIEGRGWKSCSGYRNMPDGEVFTSPVENSANGKIFFDVPTNYNGVDVENIYLELKDGKVIKATAEKGQDFLLRMLETDDGAKFVGEIAFGLNGGITTPTKNILFDEKMGQTIHMALGSSYAEAGGKNKSALHWDLIKYMSDSSYVELDGEKVYENGKFIK